MRIGVVGASGVVGRELLHILLEKAFPYESLTCFGRSLRTLVCQEQTFEVQPLALDALQQLDLLFFCAGASVSKEWIHQIGTHPRIIDLSSALRTSTHVPLVIPEINGALLTNARLVSSPNCAATTLLLPLAPLHALYRVKRLIVTTYQAASGGGTALLQRLENETRSCVQGLPPTQLPPYAFNLFLHTSQLHEDGYVEEEKKIAQEVAKILNDPEIRTSATCVRVPVLRAHAVSVNAEFACEVDLATATESLQAMPGVKLFENRQENRFATPWDASGRDEILCSRLRVDVSQPRTLEFWAVGDQLRKGAALNAVQIAQMWLQYSQTEVSPQPAFE